MPISQNMTEAELKRNGLSKNLRQHSFQDVELILLAAFDQGSSENQKKKWNKKMSDIRHLERKEHRWV